MNAMLAPAAWWSQAVCRGSGTATFFDVRGRPNHTAAAIEVCNGCPVRVDCLDAALAEETRVNFVYGVRGGRTAAQRQTMLRRRRHTRQPRR